MSNESSRREFLKTATIAGIGLYVGGRALAQTPPPSERVNFAAIGLGGKGDSDTADAARLGNLIAICDVDDNTLANAVKKYPNAKPYNDFRKMLDEMGKDIDAVTVSTPDHTHAVAAAMAMQMGKHCFCQKPLTRTIWEARRLGEIARRKRVVTQMGNQGTADSGLRRHAAIIKSGALGTVTEMHIWTNRPIWPQGHQRGAPKTAPNNLHWDLWLGPAPERPYSDNYHPFAWRGWWDFGSGALGDMACHTVNMPFMALDLRNPTSVVAQTSGHNRDSYPSWSIITFQFPAIGSRPALKMVWYDGGKKPPVDMFTGGKFEDLVIDGKLPSSGSLIIGTKDKHYTPGDYGGGGYLIGAEGLPEVTFTESPGHFEEFVIGIKGGPKPVSNFPDYAGPLTESILLGNLAVWADGKTIEWDARRLRATNAPEVADVIKPVFRKGWKV